MAEERKSLVGDYVLAERRFSGGKYDKYPSFMVLATVKYDFGKTLTPEDLVVLNPVGSGERMRNPLFCVQKSIEGIGYLLTPGSCQLPGPELQVRQSDLFKMYFGIHEVLNALESFEEYSSYAEVLRATVPVLIEETNRRNMRKCIEESFFD